MLDWRPLDHGAEFGGKVRAENQGRGAGKRHLHPGVFGEFNVSDPAVAPPHRKKRDSQEEGRRNELPQQYMRYENLRHHDKKICSECEGPQASHNNASFTKFSRSDLARQTELTCK